MDRQTIIDLVRNTAHRYSDWWILPAGDARSTELYRLYSDALTATVNAVCPPETVPGYPYTEQDI